MPLVKLGKTSRWIDGKPYYLHSYWALRKNADAWAERLRRHGYYARVIQDDVGNWKVYRSVYMKKQHGVETGYQKYRRTRGF